MRVFISILIPVIAFIISYDLIKDIPPSIGIALLSFCFIKTIYAFIDDNDSSNGGYDGGATC